MENNLGPARKQYEVSHMGNMCGLVARDSIISTAGGRRHIVQLTVLQVNNRFHNHWYYRYRLVLDSWALFTAKSSNAIVSTWYILIMHACPPQSKWVDWLFSLEWCGANKPCISWTPSVDILLYDVLLPIQMTSLHTIPKQQLTPRLAWPGLTTQRASEWAWVCGVRARECSMWPRIRSKLARRPSVGGGNKGNERQREAAGKAKLSLVRNYVSIKRRSCFYLCPLKQQHLSCIVVQR